ncbi:MAG: site-specific recombinase, phage integrase family [Acidobacteriales bacterium]|nr:site-specific recombinase, phage integrase family [Terriglobales bacterium]
MRRAKQYQNGHVQPDNRKKAYFFRWWEGDKHRSKKIGTFRELPSLSAAKRAAESLRIAINKDEILSRPQGEVVTFGKVIDAYIADDLPERHSTRRGYLAKLQNHIRPKWDGVNMLSVTPAEFETWLKGLQLSGKSKCHLRSLMHILFDSAMRRGWMKTERNPMALVRIAGATVKKKTRRGITLMQWKLLLSELSWEPLKTMAVTCACLGLRCSELFGLKWGDFDFVAEVVTIQRAIVEGHVGEVKTPSSYDILPVNQKLAESLLAWRAITPYRAETDWVFADPKSGGAMPYPGRSLQQNYITPAAVRVGIGAIGWHALRHTYRSLLGDSKISMDVQKELMRHASITTTLNVYGNAPSESKRVAHDGVVNQLLQ